MDKDTHGGLVTIEVLICLLQPATLQVVNWLEPLLFGGTPVPRQGTAAAATEGCIVMFGGTSTNTEEQLVVLDELVVFNMQGGGSMSCSINPSQVTGPRPTARTGATLLEHSPGRLLLYGGFGADGKPCDDAYVFDVDALAWKKVYSGHADMVGQEGAWAHHPLTNWHASFQPRFLGGKQRCA